MTSKAVTGVAYPAASADDVPDYARLGRLDGRVFIVLGAGQGIGRHSALALAQAGARVVCVGRREEPTRKVAEEVAGIACIADATLREDMERIFAHAQREAGPVTGLVDILGMPRIQPLAQFTDEDWQWQFDVILRHAFLSVQIGAPIIAANGGGAMVYVGTIAGLLGVRGQVGYGSAKAALHHFVKGAAIEYARKGVRINIATPGVVKTPRVVGREDDEYFGKLERANPLGRAGYPSDIASVIHFLASDMSRYVTGQNLVVDGGLSSRFSGA